MNITTPLPSLAAETISKKLATYLAIAFGLILPVSIAATNLLLPLLILLGLWQWRSLIYAGRQQQTLVLIGFALLVWIVVDTLIDTHSGRRLPAEINHFRELILIVFFLGLMTISGNPRAALMAFVAGSLLLSVAQWGTLISDRLANAMEMKRITNGFLLACAAYVAGWLAMHEKVNKTHRLIWIGAALFVVLTSVLAVRGRTGHLTIIMLVGVFAWQFASAKWRVWLTAALLIGIIGLAFLAKPVQQRLTEQSNELQSYSSGQNIATSTGARIEFARNTWDMIQRDGFLGIGYGEFEDRYKQFTRAKYLASPALQRFADDPALYPAHPHNEFLYHWICGGILGVLLLTIWLTLPVVNAVRYKGPTSDGAFAHKGASAIALAMILGCVFNVFLLNLPEGHAYIFLLAAFLSMQGTPASTISAAPREP